jgi:hypothetical protein
MRPQPPLLRLPPELHILIAKFLSPASLAALGQTNTYLRALEASIRRPMSYASFWEFKDLVLRGQCLAGGREGHEVCWGCDPSKGAYWKFRYREGRGIREEDSVGFWGVGWEVDGEEEF